MALVLKGEFGQIPYGREQAEISESEIIEKLKQYVEPAYKYTKEEAITLGVQDAIIDMFGVLPTSPRPITADDFNTLVDNALSYARDYYLMKEWEWPS